MSRLALAMIARNEAAQLPEFLSHHRDLCDAVVLVDTGSDDATVALARQAGAEVVTAPWQDDFAAARNVGLAHIDADWILILDADERVSPRDFPAVRAACAGPGDRVYLQETWNYCPAGSHLEWQPTVGRYPPEEEGCTGFFVARRVGLFPGRAGLRFTGRVHESVLPAATAAGMAVVRLDVPVHHYGYTASAGRNTDRQARYRRLVALKLAEAPGDPGAQLEMASVLLEDGDPEAAITLLVDLVRGPAGLRPVVRGLVLLGRLRREAGRLEEARNLLASAVRQDPDFIFAWLERIRVEAAADDWQAAKAVLQAAEARFGTRQPQLLREALRVQVHNRQLGAALATADRLISFCPQWQEIHGLRHRLQAMIARDRKV